MNDLSEPENLFDPQFVRHQRQVYRFVAMLLPDRDAAEDVFQQTCLAILNSREKFDPHRDFLAWAQGVARNVVREYLRANRRVPLMLSDALLARLTDTQADLASLMDARLSALDGCLLKLEQQERLLLERCYTGSEAIRAIAEQIKLAPSALYKRLDRIRWTLLSCIERAIAQEDRS